MCSLIIPVKSQERDPASCQQVSDTATSTKYAGGAQCSIHLSPREVPPSATVPPLGTPVLICVFIEEPIWPQYRNLRGGKG